MAWYRFLADVVTIVHAAYACFVVSALPLILVGVYFGWSWVKNFWLRVTHMAMIAVVVLLSLPGFDCPLTTLDNRLRALAGDAVYRGSFIGFWAHELLFFDAPPWVFTVIYCLFGALVLATLLVAPPRWPARRNGLL